MIDGKAQDPWAKLDDTTKAQVAQVEEDLGMDLHPWQRQMLACMLTDPPGTTYVISAARKGPWKLTKMAYDRIVKEHMS